VVGEENEEFVSSWRSYEVAPETLDHDTV